MLLQSFQWHIIAESGEDKVTNWYNVTFFGKLAEFAANYVRKGSEVLVEGRLTVRNYKTKDGEAGYSLDVSGTELQLAGAKDAQQTSTPSAAAAVEEEEDSIPF